MRVRNFGIAFMVLVVAAPISILALMATRRAERTAVYEVRLGNDRLATAVANQLADYVAHERRTIADFGEVICQTDDRLQRRKLGQAFLIKNQQIGKFAVYSDSGALLVGDPTLVDGLQTALSGKPVRTSVPTSEGDSAIGHMIHIAEPIVVAGKQRGAALAVVDLVGIWEPVREVTIGKSGFVRLLTMDGVLLAHGNPEENRPVDNPSADVSARLLAGALAGQLVRNKQKQEVIATAAMLPEIDAIVLVEQPAEEAYVAVASMKIQLIAIAGGTLLVAMILGFVFGGHIVRGIERLRQHTRTLPEDLTQTINPADVSRVKEIRGLADSINEMAGDLDQLQREMQERERIDTFARVASGLAHDLRHPIEAIRGAWLELIDNPDDAELRDNVDRVSNKHLPKLTRFMNDLVKLARTGDLDLEIERHDALALALEVVAEISEAPKFRGMQFAATGERAMLEIDRELVKRALYNLANNGAEACMEQGPRGSVTIEISRRDGEVVLAVTDTGVGIARERIGDVLSTSLKSTKRESGVGLGLGVVRQVAESHGGTLELESPGIGEGCTFALALPGDWTVDQDGEQGENNEPEAQAV